nr:MAG TPA: hypothetical protein [Caudoviricetes sp.]
MHRAPSCSDQLSAAHSLLLPPEDKPRASNGSPGWGL